MRSFTGLTFGALALVALGACTSPDRPKPPLELETVAPGLARDEKALRPYLEQYPLGETGRRMDLLASNEERSLHLVQTRRAIAAHYHPRRTEVAYVLTGRGTVYIDGQGYPAAPGAAFRIDPRKVHSVHPADGETLVAVIYYEPPLLVGDDRVMVDR